MSEMTTIGGVRYTVVGTDSSPLLLKNKAGVKIQWGNKLIDLIKNGKIASEGESTSISIIATESDAKSDGIYVIDSKSNPQLLVLKNGSKYNLTGSDLYISPNYKQTITVEQQKQALENIGMYYNTLEEVSNAGIQNGLVYVIEEGTLYTIKEGVVEEFKASVKTITVEKEEETGELINSSIKIVLSILEQEYIILSDNRIVANYDVHIKNSAQLGSENATDSSGYRLYMIGNKSYLDVDRINVRDGLSNENSFEIEFVELVDLVYNRNLKTQTWYTITNFQNPWELHLPAYQVVMIQAASESSFYEDGYLIDSRSEHIKYSIKYDISYQEEVTIEDVPYGAKGIVIWMKDTFNNEANFNFISKNFTKDSNISLFPVNSYNNKLHITSLKNVTITDGYIDEDASEIMFGSTEMHDNVIEGSGIIVNAYAFNNNVLSCANVIFTDDVNNSVFEKIINCSFNSEFSNVQFKTLNECSSEVGTLSNIACYNNIINYNFDASKDHLLYDSSKIKEVYFDNNTLKVYCTNEQYFTRGMIMMHSGKENIPTGWAICDGGDYDWYGETITTPDLRGRFIKAVASSEEVKAYDIHSNNQVTLTKQNLPEHTHPHKSHTHTASITTDVDTVVSTTIETSVNTTVVSSVYAPTTDETTSSGIAISRYNFDHIGKTSDIIENSAESTATSTATNIATSTATSTASINENTSVETTQSWENESFSIEPNYYALIFIMKL